MCLLDPCLSIICTGWSCCTSLRVACPGPVGSAASASTWVLSFTNPFGEHNRIPCACTHCYLAGLGHCMEYPGDGTPNMQLWGSHQAEQAHLTMADGNGPGLVHSQEQTIDPVMTQDWVTTMCMVWHLHCQELVYVEHHDQLFSERQPYESVMESGGPPDPINLWVEPMVNEQWTCAALAAPSIPSGYVDM
ncbi:uncharacterized protein UHO2_00340 [Ustilago hordei]|uniref:uncharacterized protein n=1 Tax=Ustilago hordei TaxID=120017 RepID=UPI001A5F33A6|nr:uncharacterized protein UHO2_00340 [Ustilago hordei]SYW81835.1 uncharacterized protein UHO2_00340 [Ustilago hordei]